MHDCVKIMATMTIRILTAYDATIFWEIRLRGLKDDHLAFGTTYEESKDLTLETVRQRYFQVAADNVILGAFEGDQLAGITGIYREPKQKVRHKAAIWGVYVAPEYRGRGLAKKLMQAAIDQARQWDGVAQIGLVVYMGNQSAYRLYQSLGFVTWGVEPNALYWNHEYADDMYMALKL